MTTCHAVAALCLAMLVMPVNAEVKPNAMFADHMVLQRGQGTPIYGTASPGEQVTVTFAKLPASSTTADDRGKWRIDLDLTQPGGPFELTIAGASNTVKVEDVLVGDVWICSGQSNMAMSVDQAVNGADEVAKADYPYIRLFYVDEKTALEPTDEIAVNWQVCTPKSAAKFSAVGYFFGRDVYRETGVPMGMINPNWGGTPAQAWTPRTALQAVPSLKYYAEQNLAAVAEWTRENEKYHDAIAANPAATQPAKPVPPGNPAMPTVLYNGMIHPLIPFGIKGVIWYQGEANAEKAAEYRTLYPTLISAWREAWARGDFPFYHVQLANFQARKPEPSESQWAELREAQSFAAATVPNCGQAVTIDIGDELNIHPKNKQDVGKRLALVALAETYGHQIEYSGPALESMSVHRNIVTLKFSHIGNGLIAKPDGNVKGFAIAGKDGKFVWADAKIEGKETVSVSSPEVIEPTDVRYGWADNPEVSLYNDAGLPASPFRTDAPERKRN